MLSYDTTYINEQRDISIRRLVFLPRVCVCVEIDYIYMLDWCFNREYITLHRPDTVYCMVVHFSLDVNKSIANTAHMILSFGDNHNLVAR